MYRAFNYIRNYETFGSIQKTLPVNFNLHALILFLSKGFIPLHSLYKIIIGIG